MNLETKDWLKELEEKAKGNKSKYDIIVPISGGKDGTFILWYLSKNTNLRILAYHIDNWFVTNAAENNVKSVCAELGCDCEIIRPNWSALKEIYRELVLKNGEMCIACEMMISLYPIEAAIKKQIPYIVWGLTPNQIASKKINSGYKEIDYDYYKNIVSYYEKLIEMAIDNHDRAEKIKQQLLYNNSISEEEQFPTFIMPFYWTGYDAEEIEKLVKESVSWMRPTDAGGTSSNCIINQLHIYLKKQIKGKEFYEKMMAQKYANGEVTDTVMGHALSDSENIDTIKELLYKLDINDEIDELVESIKNSKKSIFLKMESNISQ